jgi:hypothetical protein
MLFGCQNSSYKGSDINPEFPIPFEATLISKKTENQKVKTTAEYKYAKADETNSINKGYLNKIEEWGWKEHKDEQLGGLRVFEKNGTIIHIITGQGYFSISELK